VGVVQWNGDAHAVILTASCLRQQVLLRTRVGEELR
jgi:hypothetical protein